ncbi:uncharacterized protein LOC143890485 [Tasmannia lanceolata]|uniref:uncharacterized protein LOC143890485 n=1 Tax=Tasmannia lanceolata TaxID=3420 RepID=UPI004062DA06
MENPEQNSDATEELAQSYSKRARVGVNVAVLPADPGLRIRISDYHPNERDQIRRAYLQKGPHQPKDHIFPLKQFGKISRRFNPDWFEEHAGWLEYSVEKDAVFCLYCYLFKPYVGAQGGGDSFVIEGFKNWKKKEKLQKHVGGHYSVHNQARQKCEDLMKQSNFEVVENPEQSSDATEELAQSYSKRARVGVNVVDLPVDPGLRIRISDYHPNARDQIRRAYLQKGPYQPKDHIFPQKQFGKVSRRFNPAWFEEHAGWLEYSIEKEAVFCLYCYLFKPYVGAQGGGDSFIIEGFKNWKKKEKLEKHVGGHNSAHNQARQKCEDLMKQSQNIQTMINKQSDYTTG